MGVFYDSVLKMRKDGKSLVKNESIKKPTVEKKKSIETAVKKNDKSTGGKS